MLKKLKKKLGLRGGKGGAQAVRQATGEERPNVPEVAVREIKRMLFEAFSDHPSRIYDSKMAAKQIGIQGNDGRKMVHDLMREMAAEGVFEKVGAGQYRLVRKQLPTKTGRVDMTASGMAYIIVDDAAEGEKDIIVEPRNTHHALHGDRVRVAIIGRRRDGRIEGEVVETLEQGKRTFVGRIEISEKYAFVIIDSRTMPADIFVPLRSINGAENGQKVIVQIVEWPETSKNPTGEVVDVLGNSGDNNTEMHAILAEYDLPYHFPEELEQAAVREQELLAFQTEAEGLRTQLEQSKAQVRDLTQALEASQQRVQQLDLRVTQLEPDAMAYAAVKERSAGVELEAHRRAQNVLDEAKGQARHVRQQTQQWLSHMVQEYTILRRQLDSTFANAGKQLEQVNQALARQDGAFDHLRDAYAKTDPERKPAPTPLEED